MPLHRRHRLTLSATSALLRPAGARAATANPGISNAGIVVGSIEDLPGPLASLCQGIRGGLREMLKRGYNVVALLYQDGEYGLDILQDTEAALKNAKLPLIERASQSAIAALIGIDNQAVDPSCFADFLACWCEDGEFDGPGGPSAGKPAINTFTDRYRARYRLRLHRLKHVTANLVSQIDGDTARSSPPKVLCSVALASFTPAPPAATAQAQSKVRITRTIALGARCTRHWSGPFKSRSSGNSSTSVLRLPGTGDLGGGLLASGWRPRAKRPIQQQDARAAGQRPGNRHPLLRAAGALLGRVVRKAAPAHPADVAVGAAQLLVARQAAATPAEADVACGLVPGALENYPGEHPWHHATPPTKPATCCAAAQCSGCAAGTPGFQSPSARRRSLLSSCRVRSTCSSRTAHARAGF